MSAVTPFEEELRRGLFPSLPVAFAALTEPAEAEEVFPLERAAVLTACTKRQEEFFAGRVCARRALGRLGAPDRAIAIGERRAPVWPEGFLGSIAHARGLACAVAARTEELAGLGVDVEHRGRGMKPALERLICLPDELARLENGPEDRGLARYLVFCAKEALYKCLAPRVGRFFGFSAARLCEAGEGRLLLRLTEPLGPFPDGQSFEGRWLLDGDHLLTGVWWKSSPAAGEAIESRAGGADDVQPTR